MMRKCWIWALAAVAAVPLFVTAPTPPVGRAPTLHDAIKGGVNSQAELKAWTDVLDPLGAWMLSILHFWWADPAILALVHGPGGGGARGGGAVVRGGGGPQRPLVCMPPRVRGGGVGFGGFRAATCPLPGSK
ncbi:MAG: hypothetical protein FWH21_00755, partial [Kiritimatiellaeota bacterium]|nr:hypothetical protein [Kiritimatiellota bacterium]